MRIFGRILDDLLLKLYPKLLASTNQTAPTRGEARELVGVLLELERPLARLSRSEMRGRLFSCLGEFLWYLSRDNQLEFISYYISEYQKETDDGETVHGGYGRRIFHQRGYDQLQNVIDLLSNRPESRRAVIQLFNAEDLVRPYKDVPCTCTLQFLIRRGRLHLLTTMRSNDAYIGLPHDIFCFTLLQEVVARSLGVQLGRYRHFVGSLHLYNRHEEAARRYLEERVQSIVPMPQMPRGSPWASIRKVLDAEDRIRRGEDIDVDACGVEPYWADLIRLLQIYAATGDQAKIDALKAKMAFDRYGPYIEGRKSMRRRVLPPPRQLWLPF